VLSHGADTVSLWLSERGRYYHANSYFRGSVDFVCPRGWCYVTNCTFYEMKPGSAAVWHDGSKAQDMKFVLRNCRLDGTNGWVLARHHLDAQFYFLDCTFAKSMADRPIKRVIYPLNGATPSEADIQKNAENDRRNLWGERNYFWNCRREGGDFAWYSNNLATALGSPTSDQITPAWTFANTWNPERVDPPVLKEVRLTAGQFEFMFSEAVTVKGKLRLKLKHGELVDLASGSGSKTLSFKVPVEAEVEPDSLVLTDGAIVACEAGATLRVADLALPAPK
jgi:pectinesterase